MSRQSVAGRGNVFPISRMGFGPILNRMRPVELTRLLPDGEHRVTVRVTPDYVAVGSDTDYFLVPLTPRTAQRIADLVHASLPTPPIVDAVWAAASVRLGPDSIPPSPAMTTAGVRGARPAGASEAGPRRCAAGRARRGTQEGRGPHGAAGHAAGKGRDLRLAPARRPADPATLHGAQRALRGLQPRHPARQPRRPGQWCRARPPGRAARHRARGSAERRWSDPDAGVRVRRFARRSSGIVRSGPARESAA